MIYFIRDDAAAFIKIGHSANPWARLSQIQSAIPGHVVILGVEEGAAEREAELHDQFATDRVRGEWFRASDKLLAHIATLPPATRKLSSTRAFWGGKSAKELAEEVGVSPPLLSHIKNGNRRPSPEVAIRLQDATGMSAIKLVFGELAERAA